MTGTAPDLPPEYPDRLPPVELRVFTRDTYKHAFRLKVRDDQDGFVADNAGSLAQAYFHEEARPYGLYAGDVPVGFLMLSLEDIAKGTLWVWRFMIGAEHQSKGFGRQAVAAIVEHARGMEGIKEIKLSHVDGKEGNPGPFYAGLGFTYTGEVDHGERVMSRDLSPLA